jgi:hypothetical protein
VGKFNSLVLSLKADMRDFFFKLFGILLQTGQFFVTGLFDMACV